MNHKHSLLKRNFSTSQCIEKWMIDVLEFRITSCKLYLSSNMYVKLFHKKFNHIQLDSNYADIKMNF